jgi:outer membrane protein TolC
LTFGAPARAIRPLACPILVVITLIAGSSPASAALSVADCVRVAREHAPEVRIAGAARESARQDSLLHAFDLRPSWSLFGGAMVAPKGYYDPIATNLGEYELKAGMEWPLRDGGVRAHGRQRAALDAQAALLDQRLAARDAGLRAGELALANVRQAELARTQREAFEWLDRLAIDMASGVRAGTRGKADAQRAALERDDAASELESTARAGHALARELARWLGLPPDSLPEVSPPAEAGAEAPDASDSLHVLAVFAGAPELAQARLDTQRARLDLEVARRRRETQLSFALDAGLWGTDLTAAVPAAVLAENPGATFSDRLQRDLGASAALRFRLPLVDPAAPHDVAGRAAAGVAADLRAQSIASEARRAALELLDRWRDAARRTARARASVAVAEENLLRLRSLHASGAAPLLELLDARRQLDDTQARLAEARFDARLARLEAEQR